MAASSSAHRRWAAFVAGAAVLLSATGLALPARAATGDLHINFQPASAPVPAGYTADAGAAYNGTCGWQDLNGSPLDLTPNVRDRNSSLSADQRYDTQILMQAPSGSGNTTPGQWTCAVPNGQYDVTVAVGDPTATNSVDEIVVQPVDATNSTVLVDHFQPTTSALWKTVTRRVTVAGGALTLSPAGGTNTKLDFVDVVAATSDITAPTVAVSVTGPQASPGSTYSGTVTVAVTASDNVGVSGSPTYSLDGAPYQAYTGPFQVSTNTPAPHTVVAKASDAAGNTGQGSASFTIDTAAPAPPTSGHVNFQVQTTTTPVGYAGDNGQAFDAIRGYGWESAVDGSATSLVGNGRERMSTASPDKRYDTLVQMQQTSTTYGGTTTPGQWEYALVNGTYNVTVAVGDPTATNSSHEIIAEPGSGQVVLVDHFVPTSTTLFATVTRTVTVADGRLTLSATGGTNTKLDFVDIVKAAPPTASVSLSGTTDGSGTYTSDVTATIASAASPGGAAVASTTYTLDGGSPVTCVDGSPCQVVVTTDGTHTLTATTTDTTGATGSASKTWNELHSTDTSAPTVTAVLTGTQDSSGTYTGDVAVTISATDPDSAISGEGYTLDNAPAVSCTVGSACQVVVTTDANHTLTATATDPSGNLGKTTVTWSEQHSGTPKASLTGDEAVLGTPGTRLAFSTVNNVVVPPRPVTVTNSGNGPLTVSGLTFGGTNSSNWQLAAGQPSSFSVAAGSSATVSVQFTPTAPTNCPTSTSPNLIGDVVRSATLSLTTDDPTLPTATVNLSGINSCGNGGNNEPTFDQMVKALGYSTVVNSPYFDRRFMGPLRYEAGTDELQVPTFVAADATRAVTLTPLAHYGGPITSSSGGGRTGWHLKGAAVATPCSSTACSQLWSFPPDPSSTTYNQNQKLLPSYTGATAFSPGSSAFGIWSGDYGDINFSDDGLNYAKDSTGATISPVHALHDLRIYPAYGPGHVAIPGTWIVGIDITRVPSYKNNDYQDVVLLLRNAVPATPTGTRIGSVTSHNLTTGGTVSSTCQVTGFDSVLINKSGTQCDASKIAFTSSGLQLTSTAGQLADGNQQNALYDSFDASRGSFTVKARVKGPIDLASNYQQIGAWFGPDTSNFVKVEAEHNGSGTDPHLTMFYDEKGFAGTVGTVSVPALTTATTLDLIVQGSSNVPDPISGTADVSKVHGYPLAQLTVSYSIDGAAPIQIGTIRSPQDLESWFSTAAKAGILVSNSGTPTPITATFSSVQISTP